jgi:Skp family chaperone for outer membrane proteins
VKSTAIIWSGVVSLGALTVLTGPLSAQPQYQGQGGIQQANAVAPAAPRTRIAIINLQAVVKKYQKWNDFETQYKKAYDAYNAQFEAKKAEALKLKTQLQQEGPESQNRDQIEQRLRALDREAQDLGEGAKKYLTKQRDDQAVQIYREVQDAVVAYARANDLELVMHYNDAVTPADLLHPMNIQRKLQTGACMPMYYVPGMDITDAVAAMLNQRLASMQPATPH